MPERTRGGVVIAHIANSPWSLAAVLFAAVVAVLLAVVIEGRQ